MYLTADSKRTQSCISETSDEFKEDEKVEFSNEVGKVKADMRRIQIESISKEAEERNENPVTLHTSIENDIKR